MEAKTLWYGISQKGKRHKITNDKDCLPPDCERVFEATSEPFEAMVKKAKTLERDGIKVCIDLGDKFYETP